MRRTVLKGTDIETSVLGFGCSGLMGSGDSAGRQALLHRALDLGVTHFDVARLYGLGQAEAELGRFLRENRNAVTVATKFGIDPESLPLAAATRALGKLGARALVRRIEKATVPGRTHRFSVEAARSALDESLRKLRTETIDLYLLHDCAVEDVRTPGLLDFLEEAGRAGKVRAFGIATDLDPALAIVAERPEFAHVVQLENSVLSRVIDRLPGREKRAVVTHRAMSGSLTKLQEGLKARPALAQAWSAELGVDLADAGTVAKAMLAYATAANPDGVVLFSTTKPQRVQENADAVASPVLDPERALLFARRVAEAFG